MIADFETNKVYYSYQSNYSFKSEIKELKVYLKKAGVECAKIIGTKDYFCRDYMPIQKDKSTLVQFTFKPDYLLNDPELKKFVTDTRLVYRQNGFLMEYDIHYSNIIFDGGNLIKWKNKAIITDKILADNPNLIKEQIVDEIGRLLGVDVIIIPRYPIEELTGHADGLVRFIDENTVLTICLDDEIEPWKVEFVNALTVSGLKVKSLPKPLVEDKNSWGYINYLQVKGLIVLPSLNDINDNQMLEFFNKEFNGYNIKLLNSKRIIEQGGVLNCFTWNIFV